MNSGLSLLALLFASAALVASAAVAGQNRYRYSPYEKPDPFSPTIFLAAPKEAINPLQRQSLDSFILVGTIIGKESSALLSGKAEGGAMTTFVVRIGDKIGERSGTVVSIFKDRIIVRESLDSSEQREFSRFQDTALMLRPYNSNVTADLVKDVSEDAKKERSDLTEALVQDVMPRDASRTPIYPPAGGSQLRLKPSGTAVKQSMPPQISQDEAYSSSLQSIPMKAGSVNTPQSPSAPSGGSNQGSLGNMPPSTSSFSPTQNPGFVSQGGVTIQQSFPTPLYPPAPPPTQGVTPNVQP